jgi:hypothetical protein
MSWTRWRPPIDFCISVTRACRHCERRSPRREPPASERLGGPSPFVRERVESPPETYVRLLLVLAGLPEPQCNIGVGCTVAFIGRADLAYTAYRVLVEYDGRQHADTVEQWNRDLDRHDDLIAASWCCIRVTGARLRRPREVVLRVHRALVAGGYAGPAPRFGAEWVALFERTSFARRSRCNDHRMAWA